MAGLNEGDTDIPQPLTVPPEDLDAERITRPRKALPVWVRVGVDDGTGRVEVGFALAWTREHVRVQVQWAAEYYRGAREFWVEAERVTRRAIEPQWLGSDRNPRVTCTREGSSSIWAIIRRASEAARPWRRACPVGCDLIRWNTQYPPVSAPRRDLRLPDGPREPAALVRG